MEKDWLAFGHPFADRLGVPTFTGGNYTVEGLGHTPSESSAPVRNGPSSAFASSAPGAVRVTNNNESPVFLQVNNPFFKKSDLVRVQEQLHSQLVGTVVTIRLVTLCQVGIAFEKLDTIFALVVAVG